MSRTRRHQAAEKRARSTTARQAAREASPPLLRAELPVADVPLDTPYSIVHRLVAGQAQARQSGREDARRVGEVYHDHYRTLALEAVTVVHKLRGLLAASGVDESDPLARITRRLAMGIEAAGVRMISPEVGEAYGELDDGALVDIAYAPDVEDGSLLVVDQVSQAGVVLPGGEVVRRARLLLRQASAAEPADESGTEPAAQGEPGVNGQEGSAA